MDTLATVLVIAGFTAPIIPTRLPWRYSNRKIGGIRFIRVGRFVFNFCFTR